MGARPIKIKLQSGSGRLLTVWALTAAFSTYFCMYAFRKPFAVGTYEGVALLPGLPEVDLKILYILAQVIGYAASKFLGIKVVSEMPSAQRARAIGVFIGLSWLALLLFAILPAPWCALALVLNGLPLGMIWGLVFGFLEGRTVSDLLGAGLCASFIVASGFVKSVGKWVLGMGVSESWMPFATGALFLPPLGICLWMLSQVPEPSEDDIAARTERKPMSAEQRRAFAQAFAPGLSLLVLGYVLLTAYRDFRDNFAREIWDALGYADQPAILTTAELPVAFGSLLAVAVLVRFKDNRRALLAVHVLMLGGALLTGVSTLLHQLGLLSSAAWMISVGIGLYLGYVPVNCVLFDRLIAAVGRAATAGFLIYVADSTGYLGSVGLLLYKNFGQPELSWLQFFTSFSYAVAVVCSVCFALSAAYFHRMTRTEPDESRRPDRAPC